MTPDLEESSSGHPAQRSIRAIGPIRRIALGGLISSMIVLVALQPVAEAGEPAAAAAAATAPTVISPGDYTPEVPGGWTGPIQVSFVGSAVGQYAVSVDCGNGYHARFTHDVPADGDLFSSDVAPLPKNEGCGVLVTPTDDPDNPDNWLEHQDFSTANSVFEFNDAEPAADRFFPRVQDGYFDQLLIEYWLSQPAAITADIVDSNGRTVATLHATPRYSGAKGLRWDGRTSRGNVSAQGRYTARMVATNLLGQTRRATARFVLSDLLAIRPGAVGAARAGMTITRAMTTGQFNRNVRYTVPGVCTRVYPLQPKAPMTWDYSVFVQRGRIVEVTTNTKAVSLARGLKFAPTAAQVRRAYPGRVITGTAGYGNNALFVRRGKRWLAFTFNSYSYKRGLRPGDKAKSFSVSVGRRPSGMQYDGC